mgnify:CR=1 FL=1
MKQRGDISINFSPCFQQIKRLRRKKNRKGKERVVQLRLWQMENNTPPLRYWITCNHDQMNSGSASQMKRRTRGAFLESPEDFSDPKSHSLRLRHSHSVKLVFSYVVKAITIKIGAKFRASRRLAFEDTKRTMSPEMPPKSLGTFEKRAAERRISKQYLNRLHHDSHPFLHFLCF